MAKINTNSNVYTICYAALMVVLVAFLLAFVSSALKPAQDANVAIDKKKQILASLNVRGIAKSDVEAKYDELIQETYVLTPDGQQIEGADAFDVETKEIGEKFPIYLAKTAEGEDAYVLPLKGRGLWGGLWGYVALTLDCEKVLGAYFDHESETAGLGALIKEEKFQSQFIGRPVMADGKVALTVVKKGASEAETQVDGVTGATLTSKGVGEMVQSGIQQYVDVVVKGIVGAISKPAGCGRHKGCQKHEGCGQHEGCQKHEGCGQHEGCQKHEGCGQHEGCQKHEGCDGCPEKAGAEAGHKCKSGNDCCKSGTCDKSGSCGKPGCDGDKACCGHR